MREVPKFPKFDSTEIADPPSEADLTKLYFVEGVTGPGIEMKEDILPEFAQSERAELNQVEMEEIQIPKWVYAKMIRGATAEEILEVLVRRISRIPSRKMLLLAEMLINEIGRSPEGGRLIRELFTVDLSQSIQENAEGDSGEELES